jgi:hypothetical protein
MPIALNSNALVPCATLVARADPLRRPPTSYEFVYISMYITMHTLNYEKNIKNISIFPRF